MPLERHRARDLGISPGDLPTGPRNAITDVPGVNVGQVTVRRDPDIRTGVTAIVPTALDHVRALSAGLFVGNGYGKLIGATQVVELGEIETPILLTGTLSAFRVADALVSVMLERPGNAGMRSVNPVVGETNDGLLSDIRARPVTETHVREAIAAAGDGPVAEGCVGAGTGTTALGYKAGIGTSSRVVEAGTVGVLVQANIGGRLTVLGVPIDAPDEATPDPVSNNGGNSCMIVVATDAPVDARQLGRVARRAVFALGRVGVSFSHGSGDYAIAFASRPPDAPPTLDATLDPLFRGVQDAVEEAMLNSLFMAETTVGFAGNVARAVLLDSVVARCAVRGVPAVLPEQEHR